MGGSTYSYSGRLERARSRGYHTKSREEIFTQSKARKIHESMNPSGVKFREARDSENHPNTVPIILGLDTTGSMREIPHHLIKDGLPTLMSSLIQKGVPDATLLFTPFGDHETDKAPLQIGQFESGDEELDMWLERTWLEGNGGGNAGESYMLPWYFALNHVETDAWDKRKQKGFIFTIGDEPCLKHLPASAIKEIMGDAAKGDQGYTTQDLLKAVSEKYHVFHINIKHGYRTEDFKSWNDLLGQRVLTTEDYTEIPKIICDTVLSNLSEVQTTVAAKQQGDENTHASKSTEDGKKDEEIIL